MENSVTGGLAVTHDHPDGIRGEYPDIRIVMKFPRIRISRMASADDIRIPVSVVNTACSNRSDSRPEVILGVYTAGASGEKVMA